MRVEFHSLHWDNVNTQMLDAHKRVMAHFKIPVKYHNTNTWHGEWLDKVFRDNTAEIVGIIEPDLIPLNTNAFTKTVGYVARNDTFLGIAQCSNHIPPASHIYAAPGFFVMTKTVYERLGKPSCMHHQTSDTAEEISYTAERMGIKYRALMPTHYEKDSSEGPWNLGCIGRYGIGTVFDNDFYHLYQSRHAENIELFSKRCQEVLTGTFSTNGFKVATELV
jgi:hypothetical protein